MHLLAATRGLHHPQSQVTFRVREWEESRLQTAPLAPLKMSLRSALRMWQEGTRLVGWLVVASSAGEPGRPASERELFTATFNTHSHVQLLPTTVSLVSKSCWRPRRCRKIFWYLKKKEKDERKTSLLLWRLRTRSGVSRYPVTIVNNGASATRGFSSKAQVKK